MPSEISPLEPSRSLGRRLACEGILRAEFGRCECAAVTRVMEALRGKANAQELIPFPARRSVFGWNWGRPLRFASFALACLIVMTVLWLTRSAGPEPTITLTDAKAGSLLLSRAGTLQHIKTAKLRPGDLLSTVSNSSATVTYSREPTRLRLGPNTEIAFLDKSKGKHFGLYHGKVEATVGHQPPGKPMSWQTPHAVVTVVGTEFTLQVEDLSTTLQVVEGKVTFTALDTASSIQLTNGQYCTALVGAPLLPKPFPGARGSILRECWTDLQGFHVGDLTSNPRYPDQPSTSDYQTSLAGLEHRGMDYGERLRGYLYPPVTGEYQFWISATDSAQLWLSDDESPAKVQLIASVNLPVASGQWDNYPWQKSYPIKLDADRKYYIEVLHKAVKGQNDYCAVAWQTPLRKREVVPGSYLSPFLLSEDATQ